MTFSTLTFLLAFLPALLLLYFLIPKRFLAARNAVLLLFSLFFYAWGEPLYVFLIVLCVGLTYAASFGVVKRSKAAFMLALLINLVPLFVFKYADFILYNIAPLLGGRVYASGLALPIGISFYTFQAISYVVDLYRGNVKLQRNPAYLALYIFFFPQLIAGPIVRYADVEAEICARESTIAGAAEGARRFILGLSKKMLIANQAGYVVSVIQAQDAAQMGAGVLWVSVLAYGVQIYFDFSGYSDMAIGLGRIFGFRFLENFDKPYIARSITDFWRRWHISLSSFFRDYVYIPLGGSRVGVARHIFNLFVVWFLTGLWHGAFWNYALWGLYYFLLLVLEKYVYGRYLDKAPALLARALTFFLFMFGWAIFMFESNSLSAILRHLGMLLGIVPSAYTISLRALGVQGGVIVSAMGLLLSMLPLPAFLRRLPAKDERDTKRRASAAVAQPLTDAEKESLRALLLENAARVFERAAQKTQSAAEALALSKVVFQKARETYKNAPADASAWLLSLCDAAEPSAQPPAAPDGDALAAVLGRYTKTIYLRALEQLGAPDAALDVSERVIEKIKEDGLPRSSDAETAILAVCDSMCLTQRGKKRAAPQRVAPQRALARQLLQYATLFGLLLLSLFFIVGESFNPFIYFRF